MAFNNAGLGYVHAMAHQLSGFYGLAHGGANAILLPHVERYNMISSPREFADITVAMGRNIEGLSMRQAAGKSYRCYNTIIKRYRNTRWFIQNSI